jgi:hypothetical protein
VHPAIRDALFRRSALQFGDDGRVGWARGQIERLRPGDLQAAPLSDLPHQLFLSRMLGVHRLLIRMARVEGKGDLVWDGRRQVRLDLHLPDRRHRRRPALQRNADHRGDDLREACHRVEPSLHRSGTGVVGSAAQFDHVVADGRDCVDNAHLQAVRFQDRTLLDVELDPGIEVIALRLPDPLRVETDAAHRLPDRRAVAVADQVWLLR